MWSVVGWSPQALLRPCVSESEGGPERGGAKTARFRWAGGMQVTGITLNCKSWKAVVVFSENKNISWILAERVHLNFTQLQQTCLFSFWRITKMWSNRTQVSNWIQTGSRFTCSLRCDSDSDWTAAAAVRASLCPSWLPVSACWARRWFGLRGYKLQSLAMRLSLPTGGSGAPRCSRSEPDRGRGQAQRGWGLICHLAVLTCWRKQNALQESVLWSRVWGNILSGSTLRFYYYKWGMLPW